MTNYMNRLVLLVTLSACATVPVARIDLDERAKLSPPSGGAATVFVYRPHAVVGVAVTVEVTVDEVRVGRLAPGTFTRLTLRPGEHKLVARVDGHAEQTIVVDGARSYFVKVGPAWGWKNGTNASAEVVTDERAAREEIAGCALIADPAADAIRRIAEGISGAMIDPVAPDSLVAVASLELAPSRTAAGARPPELEPAIAELRATRTGVTDGEVVLAAVRSMSASLRSGTVSERLALVKAIDERLGVAVTLEGHDPVISGVLPDSPAALAGIDPGAKLREVNGQSARGHAPSEVLRLLEGAAGAEVALTLGGADGGERRVILHRALAGAPAVECRIVDSRVLYLRPWNLQPAAARRVRDDARSVGAAAALVILDLRDAAVGTVEGVRDLVDSFLAGGTIASLAYARTPKANRAYVATPGTSSLEQARLAVLVNGNTAGVAEAAAAAVQDQRRGTVLGSKTAREGVVGAPHDISGVRVWVPFARLLRASGDRIDASGVIPDVLDGSATPAPITQTSDVACPNTVSRTPAASDPLVRHAAALLISASAR